MTTVFNLATEERREYSLSPVDAVIAAYAQSKGDWNTWDYQTKYADLVLTNGIVVTIEDWSAFLD